VIPFPVVENTAHAKRRESGSPIRRARWFVRTASNIRRNTIVGVLLMEHHSPTNRMTTPAVIPVSESVAERSARMKRCIIQPDTRA
jgi:hypothetical protein